MNAPIEVKMSAQLRDALLTAERWESMYESVEAQAHRLLLERDALLQAQSQRENLDTALLAETMADAVCAPGESAWKYLSESEKEHWLRAAYVARAAFGANKPPSPALAQHMADVNTRTNAAMTPKEKRASAAIQKATGGSQ